MTILLFTFFRWGELPQLGTLSGNLSAVWLSTGEVIAFRSYPSLPFLFETLTMPLRRSDATWKIISNCPVKIDATECHDRAIVHFNFNETYLFAPPSEQLCRGQWTSIVSGRFIDGLCYSLGRLYGMSKCFFFKQYFSLSVSLSWLVWVLLFCKASPVASGCSV